MKAANGGLLYRCVYCEKIDRKGRLTDHVLRDHVAIEKRSVSLSAVQVLHSGQAEVP
ncbi:hypothetical protein DPMN_119125 [Dreissena polymorpha]|uniref:Uncharacterized protein n=1 Tax=Dreissena polymorpha TaxID=45954 RepID=A0A9D4GLF5_DREPO|nr:hypothetical protein DPMN_119125 [Dreissena polymorpha]